MAPSAGENPSVPRGTRLPRPARRAQLLGAALEVFVEYGYHAAGMDEIADRAGVSKPVLYQHFPGKLELYLALLDSATEQLVDAVLAALESTQDNDARVVATVEAYFEFVGRHGAAYRLVFESDLRQEPQVARRVLRVEERTSAAIARIVRDATDLDEEEALLLATGVVGMAQTSARFWLAQGCPIPRDAAARLVADLVWRGVSSFPLAQSAAPEDPRLGVAEETAP
ncbi:TetR/AcrR family transcriptional regulator [Gephyromycinifex aptenodytis]|uniref:TetR/AcrR family transcriptional regulator n=1 Tax=Gephyromycinifex aptenodytis TaxID=2716227 RepID=UPI00144632A9|nr:TetR/AcrR family transcriptional regulator [Gephyromycinifex aptenodytis]